MNLRQKQPEIAGSILRYNARPNYRIVKTSVFADDLGLLAMVLKTLAQRSCFAYGCGRSASMMTMRSPSFSVLSAVSGTIRVLTATR